MFRLRCVLNNKSTPATPINQSNEMHPSHSSVSSDPSIVEMQNIVNKDFTKFIY